LPSGGENTPYPLDIIVNAAIIDVVMITLSIHKI